MSGKPVTSCAAAAIVPPRPRTKPEAQFSISADRTFGANLAESPCGAIAAVADGKYHNFSWTWAVRTRAPMRFSSGEYHAGSSAEFRRLKVVVGLDDLAQAVFQRAITAVGVRMMALLQYLEPHLDPG